jgi:hypothetical protein
MKRRTLVLGGAAALAGCGGGGSRVSFKPGRAVFTIEWPKSTTRLIPAASNSIVVEVRQNGELLGRQTVVRPATTLTFTRLPEGDLNALATSYPTTDGTGVALASGITVLPVRDGTTVQVPLTMNSTIASFSVAPATLGVGETRRILATPKNAEGAVVLIPGYQLRMEVIGGAGNIDWAAPFFNATGRNAGIVTFRVTDTESGISGNATLEIGPPAPPRPVFIILPPGDSTSGVDSINYIIWEPFNIPGGVSSLTHGDIIAKDPDTGIAFRRIYFEPIINPGRIVVTSDSKWLYYSNGFQVRRVNPISGKNELFCSMQQATLLIDILPGPSYLPVARFNSNITPFVLSSSGVPLPNMITNSNTVVSQDGTIAYGLVRENQASPYIVTSYNIDTSVGMIPNTSKIWNASFEMIFSRDGYAYSYNVQPENPRKIYNAVTLDDVGFIDMPNAQVAYQLVGNRFDDDVYSLAFSGANLLIFRQNGAPLQVSSITTCPVPNIVYPYPNSLGRNRVLIEDSPSPPGKRRWIVCNGS